MFVNFAKEQTDGDCLTDVIIGNGATKLNLPTRINLPPTFQPQQPTTPQQQRKSPQLLAKSPETDPKESKPKRAKARRVSSNGETSSSVPMSRLPQAGENDPEAGSSNGGLQRESSKRQRSKYGEESSRKDPAALFIVGTNSQDSSL